MDLGLTGKVCLVSGGSKGIGKAVARLFLAEGAKVVIVARTPETLAETKAEFEAAAPGRVHAISADLTDAASVQAAVAQAKAVFGPIDVAISNVIGTVVHAKADDDTARKGPAAGHFETLGQDDFHVGFQQLVMSAWYLAYAVLPDMRARKWGRIVNIGSKVAREPKWEIPHVLPNVVRPAVAGLYNTLAAEVFADGITVNNALTGSIATERNRAYMTWLAGERGTSIEERDREHHAVNAIKRPGLPEEMAGLVGFWCSPAARYITGQSIAVDGGSSRHIY